MFTGSKQTQIINLSNIPDQIVGASYPLNATASSGLSVAYRVVAGGAFIQQNSSVVCNDTGTVVVEATQLGNASFFSAYPEVRTFKVLPAPTSTPILNKNAQNIAIYPNPAEKVFLIEGENLQGSWLQMTDINGKVCYRTQLQTQQTPITVAHLPRGMYIIHITGNVNTVKKIVVK